MLAATDNNAYNTLIQRILTRIGPASCYSVNTAEEEQSKWNALNFTLGGRPQLKSKNLQDFNRDMFMGRSVQTTQMSEAYTLNIHGHAPRGFYPTYVDKPQQAGSLRGTPKVHCPRPAIQLSALAPSQNRRAL